MYFYTMINFHNILLVITVTWKFVENHIYMAITLNTGKKSREIVFSTLITKYPKYKLR